MLQSSGKRKSFRAIAFGETRPHGETEYRWASTALRASGHLGTLKLAIGLLCFSMVALGVIVEFHPAGPQGQLLLAHRLVLLSTAVVGVWWWTARWLG